MKFNQTLAVAVIAASAGIFGMSSAALAGSSISVDGDTATGGKDGAAAAFVQATMDVNGTIRNLNVGVAAGEDSAAVTGSMILRPNGKKIFDASAAAGEANEAKVVGADGSKIKLKDDLGL
ncbi:MAG: hypothetical protein QNJ51_18380 [Calothrix sp. MO_167.B12]|nr:hypothetical protein [Calothrix sp. MO_167.B12]